MKLRYIRPDGELADETIVVVRGGSLDRASLLEDAVASFEIYGVHAVSVFALDGVTLDELAQQSPLVRFEYLTLMTVGAVRTAGLRLVATGRRPLHYSIEFDRIEDGLDRLRSCEHRSVSNPYHVR